MFEDTYARTQMLIVSDLMTVTEQMLNGQITLGEYFVRVYELECEHHKNEQRHHLMEVRNEQKMDL